MTVTAEDLREALKIRYAGDGFVVLFEVGEQTGGAGSSRWADALVVGLWDSNDRQVIGFEIKVSKGDWKRELADPDKSRPVGRYCDAWFVVAPSTDVVDAATLPPGWGLMTLDAKGELRQRVASKGWPKPEPIPRHFLGMLLRRATQVETNYLRHVLSMRRALRSAADHSERALRENILHPLNDLFYHITPETTVADLKDGLEKLLGSSYMRRHGGGIGELAEAFLKGDGTE